MLQYVQNTMNSMDAQSLERFVESWGSMGTLWGINRSMARVHALLLAAEEPLRLDEIATRLDISRGNASMSLKELRSWGVIQRVHRPGDRCDFYVAESDMWQMLFRIVSERKKREFDPLLETIQASLSRRDMGPEVRARLDQMEELLSAVNRLASRMLADEGAARAMFKFLTMQIGGD